jgi:hypothetical protein
VFYKIAESLIHSYNIFIPGIEAASVYDVKEEDENQIIKLDEVTDEEIKHRKKNCCK